MLSTATSIVLALVSAAQPIGADAWSEDLDHLVETLPARHPDAFRRVEPDAFARATERVRAGLGEWDDRRTVLEFAKLVALVGDSHTGVDWCSVDCDTGQLPVLVADLSDGVFVVAAGDGLGGLMGARVVELNGTPVGEAIERVSVLFGWENASKRRDGAARLLGLPIALEAVGLADSRHDPVELTIADGDGRRRVRVEPVADGAVAWTAWHERLDEQPFRIRHARGSYRSQFLREPRVMYVAYNVCRSAPDLPFDDFTDFVVEKSDELGARRIVIDLRRNAGGNSRVFRPMLRALARSTRFADHGDVIVLVGRRTFSSAVMNALELREIGAVLVGEPTGGAPNHFGEVRSFTLPRSGLRILHSTKEFRLVPGDADSVAPDVRVEIDARALFAGEDPALDAAIRYAGDGAP